VLGLLPGGGHEAFKTVGARADDPISTELLAVQLKQEGRPVALRGSLDEPGLEASQVARTALAKPDIRRNLIEGDRSTCAGAGLLAVFAEFEREILRERVKA
jgi:hypothetical protein